jgi:beta-lactamase superfamily II metal-dependent hydrolase
MRFRRLLRSAAVVFVFSTACAQQAPPFAKARQAPESPQTPSNGRLQIHFMNVGQGDGAILISPEGETVLFDNGVWNHCKGPVDYLRHLGVKQIDYQIISHYHADHLGCSKQVLALAPLIKASFDRGGSYPGDSFQRYVEAVKGKRQTVKKGQVVELDEDSNDPVTIKFVALNGNGVQTDNENDKSVVALISFEDFRAEIGGDLSGFKENDYEDIETGVAHDVGRVDVYKVHHHGSAYSSNEAWIKELQPRVGIVSVGIDNHHEHPRLECLERLHDAGVKTYWTTEGGGVEPLDGMDFVGGDIIVEVAKQSHQFTVRSAEQNFPAIGYATWASALQTQPSREEPSSPVASPEASRKTLISQYPTTTVILAVSFPIVIFGFLVRREVMGHRLGQTIAKDVIKRLRQPEWEFTRFGLRALVSSSYDSVLATAMQPDITVDYVIEQAVASLVRGDYASPSSEEKVSEAETKGLIAKLQTLHSDPEGVTDVVIPRASMTFAKAALAMALLLTIIQIVPSVESTLLRWFGENSVLEELFGAALATIAGGSATWLRKKSSQRATTETPESAPPTKRTGRRFR